MRNNNQSNRLIKWIVMFGDFVLLNAIILTGATLSWRISSWPDRSLEIFILVNNIALMMAQMRFSTIIHLRIVGAGDVLQRVVGLTALQSALAYVLLKVFDYNLPIGWLQWGIGTLFFAALLVKRLCERWFVKLYRQAGRNTRTVTLVGNDPELMNVYHKLVTDQTMGYRVLGYYADMEIGEWTYPSDELRFKNDELERIKKAGRGENLELKHLGTLQEFLRMMREDPEQLGLGDEMYVSLSRRDREVVKRISRFCDHRVIRFFYVPVSVESIGLNLKREALDDMEIYTTYENPLQNSINRTVKRVFDIVLSLMFLIPTAIIFPIIFLIIKIQSPGPILFKQKRTGLDGKTFNCYKFRSMHVNADADKVQATKNDPRKYPFGNFMRKANIDELPQFINVLQGRMSIVGPRPHMLAHTEQYSELIDKYMVRHFVKPGVTGWAQVTGYRGETKELWQMEGRVKRDIWYMEHWSIWLDFRIIWLTFKSMFIHDKNAY
jgi:putative colanic acid biosynthesis UDP-glucose lipid carrier transferase